MKKFKPTHGIGTIVTQAGEGNQPLWSHIMPLFQTSAFSSASVDELVATFEGAPGYYYSRSGNPNLTHTAQKIALLESIDLLREQPNQPPEEVAMGALFASGMGAIAAAIFGRVKQGDKIIAQRSLYGGTYKLINEIARDLGIHPIWVDNLNPEGWEAALKTNPDARLVYAETPINPTMQLVDLNAVAELAHAHDAWLMVDNTFATPFCQRPLTLGADVVLHSTTKYLAGHGVVIGGAVVSPHLDYMKADVMRMRKTFGAVPSPFDAWLTHLGMKTFELRMQRHCENALALAKFLENHSKVTAVNYPGLPSHPQHELAKRQMHGYSGMLSFVLDGGLEAGVKLMDSVKLMTLIPSLGNVDTILAHPATMSHKDIPPEERRKAGIFDGLIRLSVGIENVEDLIADLDQAIGESG